MPKVLANIADVEAPEIGRMYLVPCVYGIWGTLRDWWPVLGPWHEDREIIGFPKPHYHLDPRFVRELTPHRTRTLTPIMTVREFSMPMQEWEATTHKGVPVIGTGQKLGDPVLRRRRLRRHMPEYPRAVAPWLTRLECAYRNHRLKAGLVCPHRGAPLRGLPVDSSGCVTCPLHGLRWNVATGELAPTNPDCVNFYSATSLPPLKAKP